MFARDLSDLNRPTARARIESVIERLIAMLDAIDGDPDLEDGRDAEPEETDCDLAGADTDLEYDAGVDGDGGLIWGGGESTSEPNWFGSPV